MVIRSTLFDLIDLSLFNKWQEQAEKQSLEFWGDTIEKYKKELLQDSDEKQNEILERFRISVENKMIDIILQLCSKTLHFGVKIGIELGEDFISIDNGDY